MTPSDSGLTQLAWHEVEGPAVESYAFCGGQIIACMQRCPTRQTSPNEDSACVWQASADLGLLAVADGVGGAAAGNRASREIIEQLFAHCREVKSGRQRQPNDLRSAILDAIDAANQHILDWSIGAGTTLTAIQFDAATLRAYHVGDSAAMLVSNRGNIKYATVGHAPVARAVEIGMLEADEALVHEDRNLISNCLGSESMKIEIGPQLSMSARDTLILASDGLFDNLTEDEVAEIIRKGNLRDQTEQLLANVNQRMNAPTSETTPSKPDDLSMLLFRLS